MTSTETLPIQTLRISYSRWEPCVGFCGDGADDVICVECGWLREEHPAPDASA
jgi:hypothetical protein